jgi:hypothetical protein
MHIEIVSVIANIENSDLWMKNELSVVTDCESHLRMVWKTYLLFGCVKYMCSAIFLVQKQYSLSGLCQLLKTQ